MERVFHFLTFFFQGSSFLNPRAYAIMHREHHAYSDTEKDPHSPHFFTDVFQMMWRTAQSYGVDEIVAVTIAEDFNDRLQSYKLLADMFEL